MDRRWNVVGTYKLVYDSEFDILNWCHKSLRMDFYIFQQYTIYRMDNLSLQRILVDNLAVNRSNLANTNTTGCYHLADIRHTIHMAMARMDLRGVALVLHAPVELDSIGQMDLRLNRSDNCKSDYGW